MAMLKVAARPEPLQVDPRRMAVLVIDAQNDFAAPGGMFDRAGIDVSGIVAAVDATGPVLGAARASGIPVVFVNMEHAPDLADAGPVDGPHRVKHRPLGLGEAVTGGDGSAARILIRDTWNTANVAGLEPRDGDIVLSKHRYSAFYETGLDEVLRGLDVTHLVVTGCTTSVCVDSTVRDATFRDYACIVLEDCTAEPLGTHDASLKVIETLFGWVTNSAALLSELARTAPATDVPPTTPRPPVDSPGTEI
jgi:ureidoacrylate peracid hydrolase